MVPSRNGIAVPFACIVMAGFVLAGSALVVPTHAADLNEIKNDQRQVELGLALTNQALGKANTKLQKALTAATSAQRSLEKAQSQKEAAQQEADRAKAVAESARVESEYAESALILGSRALKRLNRQLENQRGDIEDMARAIYQQGPLSEVGVLMSAQDPADFTARMVAVNYVSREQQGMERTILASSADAMRQEVKLTALTEKASATRSHAEREQAKALKALESAKDKQRAVLQVRKEMRQAVKAAKVFKGKIKNRFERLKREQRNLEVAAKKAAAQAAATQSSQSPSGSLTWPLPGHSKGGDAGPRIHPIYGYSSCHTGIDIGAPSGTSAISVDAGSVATITSGGPYGNAVLVAHGGGLTTFYAHLSSVSVNVGEVLNAGQEVGKVGSTGWSTGPHLHFETRLEGTAYDPMGWFGQSMRAVPC